MEIILIMGILLFLTIVFVVYCFIKAYNPNIHILHCWHKIKNSEIKIKQNTKCQEQSLYTTYINGYFCITYNYEEKCCICGKIRHQIGYDYNINRALNFNDKEG